MDDKRTKVDVFFLLILIELFVLGSLFILNAEFASLKNYILLGAAYMIVIISFYTDMVAGMLASLILDFAYGSYLLYMTIRAGVLGYTFAEDYLWIAVFPLLAYTAGKYGYYIGKLRKAQEKLLYEVSNLVRIDEVTNLNNKNQFYKDLSEEMSRARRHGFQMAVMLIQIEYYSELLSVYGVAKVDEILNQIADKLEMVTRDEDKRYKLDHGMFAAILPNTPEEGALIVKDRLRKELDEGTVSSKKEMQKLSIRFRIALKTYDRKIQGAFEYKEELERELEYDV